MGKCKYCGQDAVFFHSKHTECEQRHLSGVARIKSILADCFHHKKDYQLHHSEALIMIALILMSDSEEPVPLKDSKMYQRWKEA